MDPMGETAMPLSKTSARPNSLETFWRGFRRSCPRCGKGHLFSGYLSVRTACDVCGLEFEPLRSDDAPPYFTLLIVGHLVVSLYMALWQLMDIPAWGQAIIWCSLTAILSLVLLPFIKGGVMAVIFLTKAKA
jgi:uncharacterized protein (DUF983 family)